MLLDRQIRNIQREEEKVKASLKQAAKKGDRDVCVILAKEIVGSRKAISRIQTSKAQLNSVALHMTQQTANLRVAGAMQKSAEVMKMMHNLVKVGEISHTMEELSREMMRAGIIEEMMEETLDEVTGIDEDEMEEQVQAEVDKVLFELTAGKLSFHLHTIRHRAPFVHVNVTTNLRFLTVLLSTDCQVSILTVLSVSLSIYTI